MRCTLVTDGSSDTVLIPLLRWLFAQITAIPPEIQWADLTFLRQNPRALQDRLTCAVEYYPCELLLVHRDAEKEPPDARYSEIRRAAPSGLRYVGVVPVRMQEAWLLLNEDAIREAAGRPSGREPLGLCGPRDWEQLADPKSTLHNALLTASGTRGRRRQKFSPERAAHRVAELVTDWSPLRQLTAFRRLEEDLRAALQEPPR